MKSPAFQFYAKQWLGDDNIMLMDWDARGMHLHFMCIAWQQENPCTLPDDDAILMKWVGNPKGWDRLKKQIFRAWKLKNGLWVQEGLLREYEKQAKFSESRRNNALKRDYHKSEPQKTDASAMQVQCTDHALQSSSSFTSSKKDNTSPLPPITTQDELINLLGAKKAEYYMKRVRSWAKKNHMTVKDEIGMAVRFSIDDDLKLARKKNEKT